MSAFSFLSTARIILLSPVTEKKKVECRSYTGLQRRYSLTIRKLYVPDKYWDPQNQCIMGNSVWSVSLL